jgi:opine dehydrogenase
MKLSVIGAGNTGYAAAAYFSNLNQEVTLYTRDSGKAKLINNNGITSTGKLEGNFAVHAVSSISEAVKGADYLCIFTMANHHKEVFKAISGLLENNQGIIVFNGNWGAYEAHHILENELINKNILLAESSSMPFIAGSSTNGQVNVLAIKKQIGFATFKPTSSSKLLYDFATLFPEIIVHNNIIESSLLATNPIIHVPITLFNIIRIEEGHDFKFYADGTSDLCIGFMEKIDEERIHIGKKLGIEMKGLLNSINSFWGKKYDNLLDALRQSYPYTKAPTTIKHRYLTEDVPYGIVPIVKLGSLLGLNAAYSKSTIDIINQYTTADYYEDGIDFDLDKIYKIIGAF